MTLNEQQEALCASNYPDMTEHGWDRSFIRWATGGLSNHGNDRQTMEAGCRFDFENPEHRV